MHTAYTAIKLMSITSGGRGGTVANISSIGGLDYMFSTPAYSASKYGVVGLTRCLGVSNRWIVSYWFCALIIDKITGQLLLQKAWIEIYDHLPRIYRNTDPGWAGRQIDRRRHFEENTENSKQTGFAKVSIKFCFKINFVFSIYVIVSEHQQWAKLWLTFWQKTKTVRFGWLTMVNTKKSTFQFTLVWNLVS